jgi:hypothetical protein
MLWPAATPLARGPRAGVNAAQSERT